MTKFANSVVVAKFKLIIRHTYGLHCTNHFPNQHSFTLLLKTSKLNHFQFSVMHLKPDMLKMPQHVISTDLARFPNLIYTITTGWKTSTELPINSFPLNRPIFSQDITIFCIELLRKRQKNTNNVEVFIY